MFSDSESLTDPPSNKLNIIKNISTKQSEREETKSARKLTGQQSMICGYNWLWVYQSERNRTVRENELEWEK